MGLISLKKSLINSISSSEKPSVSFEIEVFSSLWLDKYDFITPFGFGLSSYSDDDLCSILFLL